MGLFNWLKKRKFFSADEERRILESIKQAEGNSSGEIRVFAESSCKGQQPLERAAAVFNELGMNKTHGRNAVLVYVASKDHKYAIYGDEGIYKAFGTDFWEEKVKAFKHYFQSHELAEAICRVILETGTTLQEKFPSLGEEDKNELPDEIAFGS